MARGGPTPHVAFRRSDRPEARAAAESPVGRATGAPEGRGRLVLLNFLMLFVELALIRWAGSNVVYLSYFRTSSCSAASWDRHRIPAIRVEGRIVSESGACTRDLRSVRRGRPPFGARSDRATVARHTPLPPLCGAPRDPARVDRASGLAALPFDRSAFPRCSCDRVRPDLRGEPHLRRAVQERWIVRVRVRGESARGDGRWGARIRRPRGGLSRFAIIVAALYLLAFACRPKDTAKAGNGKVSPAWKLPRSRLSRSVSSATS
jgi:hypothetical protein